MAENKVILPGVETENYSLGMDSLTDPSILPKNVHQLMQNVLPGGKPREALVNRSQWKNTDGSAFYNAEFVQSEVFTIGGYDHVITFEKNATDYQCVVASFDKATPGAATHYLLFKIDIPSTTSGVSAFSIQQLQDKLYLTIPESLIGVDGNISLFILSQSGAGYKTKKPGLIFAINNTSHVLEVISGNYQEASKIALVLSNYYRDEYSGLLISRKTQLPKTIITWDSVSSRDLFAHCVHRGKYYISGGVTNTSNLNIPHNNSWGSAPCYNDICSTEDFIKWDTSHDKITILNTPVLEAPLFCHMMASYNNKLFIVTCGLFSRTYYSEEGSNWTKLTCDLPGERYNGTMFVYNNKLTVVGGSLVPTVSGNYVRSIYQSTDGFSWSLVVADCGFDMTNSKSACVINDVIYCVDDSGSIWASTPGDPTTWTKKRTVSGGKFLYNIGDTLFVGAPVSGYQTVQIHVSYDLGGTFALFSTETTPHAKFPIFYKDRIYLFSSNNQALRTVHYSDNGKDFSSDLGVNSLLTYSYATTFVRLTDLVKKDDSSEFSSWENIESSPAGFPIMAPGIDERAYPVEFQIDPSNQRFFTTGGEPLGVGTQNNDKVRFSGLDGVFTVTLTGSVLFSVVEPIPEYFSQTITNYSLIGKLSSLPRVGESVSSDIYRDAELIEIENIDNRTIVSGDSVSGKNSFLLAINYDLAQAALLEGATHIRIWRTLGQTDSTIAAGASHRFLFDLAIPKERVFKSAIYLIYTETCQPESYHPDYLIYRDTLSDNILFGETHLLDTTGLNGVPAGRLGSISNQGRRFVGGQDSNKGYWYYSNPTSSLLEPSKDMVLFNQKTGYLTCDPEDGTYDTGTESLCGDRYFFKEGKIFVLNNDNVDNVPLLVSNIGCIAPASLIKMNTLKYGEVFGFLSEYGPALMSAGGTTQIFYKFAIAELFPGNSKSIIPCSWADVQKIRCAYSHGCWWFAFNFSTPKLYGFKFDVGDGFEGAFEVTQSKDPRSTEVWNQLFDIADILPSGNNAAYGIAYHTHVYAVNKTETRICDFFKDGVFQDRAYKANGTDLDNFDYSMVTRSRSLIPGPLQRDIGDFSGGYFYIAFNDDLGLKISCRSNGGARTATWAYRNKRRIKVDHVELDERRELEGVEFDLNIEKVVPPDGNVKLFGEQMLSTRKSTISSSAKADFDSYFENAES